MLADEGAAEEEGDGAVAEEDALRKRSPMTRSLRLSHSSAWRAFRMVSRLALSEFCLLSASEESVTSSE